MLFPFRYVNTLAIGTHIVTINYPTPARLQKLYVEVDNPVTISDNHNIIAGSHGSTNTLTLDSLYDPPIKVDMGISPIEITIVTTVETRIAVYAELEV